MKWSKDSLEELPKEAQGQEKPSAIQKELDQFVKGTGLWQDLKEPRGGFNSPETLSQSNISHYKLNKIMSIKLAETAHDSGATTLLCENISTMPNRSKNSN